MNALSRPLFSAPPEMVEGSGITSMAMGGEQGMPMGEEQAARDIGGMIAGQLAAGVDQTEQNIDAVAEDDTGGLMNALRDKNASVEEYRDELAEVVGPKDAAATPESVLALVQPTLAMMEMTEGIGALEGNMGDISAMGGDMGGMGGMGSGIGDMLPQGLPQGLPMPMGDETVAVQEEIVGRMPPVEGMQRGGVVSIPAGKKSLPFDPNNPLVQRMSRGREVTSLAERVSEIGSILPEFPGRTERTTTDNLIDILAAGATGYLSGGVRGLTGNVAKVLPALTEQKRKKDRQEQLAQYQRNLNIGNLAYGTYTAEQAAKKDREAKIAAALAGKATTVGPLEKMMQGQARARARLAKDPNNPQLKKTVERFDQAITAEAGKMSEGEGIVAGAQIDTIGGLLEEEVKGVNKRIDSEIEKLSSLESTARKARDLSTAIESYGGTGVFGRTKLKAAQVVGFLTDTFGLDRKVADGIRGRLDLPEEKDISIGQLIESMGADMDLVYTQLVPGNLNQAEVDLVRSVGADLFTTAAGAKLLAEVQQRALARQRAVVERLSGVKQKFLQGVGKDLRSVGLGDLNAAMQKERSAINEEFNSDVSITDQVRGHLVVTRYEPNVERMVSILSEAKGLESTIMEPGNEVILEGMTFRGEAPEAKINQAAKALYRELLSDRNLARLPNERRLYYINSLINKTEANTELLNSYPNASKVYRRLLEFELMRQKGAE
jgi:hypothetical protein